MEHWPEHFLAEEQPRMSQKWAAALRGEEPMDGGEVLEENEALEFLSAVEAHQTDSLAILQKFEKLRSVTLCKVDLRDGQVPVGLACCRNLVHLDLSANKLTLIPGVIFSLLSLKDINFGLNSIKAIPIDMKLLTKLENINLSYNRIRDFSPVTACKSLRTLWIDNNRLRGVPAEISTLSELKEVDLSKNEITGITPILACTKVQVLKVHGNKLARPGLPSGLEKLIELKEVDLSINMITDITPVTGCIKLQVLKVMANKLVRLPAGLEKLTGLKQVDLSYNEITDITPILGCREVQILTVTHNKLVSLPVGLEKLPELKEIDLAHNEITDITPILGCRKVQILKVTHNRLVGLPAGLEKLSELEELNVASNNLSKLPQGICQLKKLTWLNINENDIHQLPLHFDRCHSLTYMKCDGNPLTRPPREVFSSGLTAIFQYFKDLRESECSIRKQQVVLLGETGAGKTSLALTLKDGKSSLTGESDRTHVLQKYIWDVNDDLKLNITDFGGHHVYELAHTFFLCSEVIALLAVDLSRYSNGVYGDVVGRWVNSILFMSPKSTVMVVGTHSDCCTKDSAEKAKSDIAIQITKQRTQMAECVESQLHNIEVKLNSAAEDGSPEIQSYLSYLTQMQDTKRQQLISLRSNIVQSEHVFVVSSSSLDGIPELQDALIRCCDSKAVTLPGSWLSIQDILDGEDIKVKLFIQYDEFCEIVHRGLSSSGYPADQSDC